MREIAYILLLVGVLFALPAETAISQKKDRQYFETRGDIVWEIPTERKEIALTFDDGPDPRYTTQIANLLQQYDAKATFFVVGSRVKMHPDVALRLSKGGRLPGHHVVLAPGYARLERPRRPKNRQQGCPKCAQRRYRAFPRLRRKASANRGRAARNPARTEEAMRENINPQTGRVPPGGDLFS